MPSHRSSTPFEPARPDPELRELDAALMSLRKAVDNYGASRRPPPAAAPLVSTPATLIGRVAVRLRKLAERFFFVKRPRAR